MFRSKYRLIIVRVSTIIIIHHVMHLPTNIAPTATTETRLGTKATAAFTPNDCLLVLPSFCLPLDPECPFDVANTPASTVAVFSVFVIAVVGNVCCGP
jgi:hypothetical protein